jgi:hypothetical protein
MNAHRTTADDAMEYGRIIRIVRRHGEVETYVIAEPDKAKAVAKVAARAATKLDRVEPIGRASRRPPERNGPRARRIQ